MGWLHVAGSSKLQVSFAKEPYERDGILQKRPIILRGLLIVATPYEHISADIWLIGLFCRISSLFKGSFAKETYNFKEPTNRSHPI